MRIDVAKKLLGQTQYKIYEVLTIIVLTDLTYF